MPIISITLPPITILNGSTPPQPAVPDLTSLEADGSYYLGIEDEGQYLGGVIPVDKAENAINLVDASGFYVYVEDRGNNNYNASFNEKYSTPLSDIPSYNYETVRCSAIIENATLDAPNNRITADLILEIGDFVFKMVQGVFTRDVNNLVSLGDFIFIPN